MRADLFLVAEGLASSRTKAADLIAKGSVLLDGVPLDKASRELSPGDEARITVTDRPRFVSRGGEKMAGAIRAFGLGVSGAICADIGASTGGFTDCLLQSGAARVYAVDVGSGQLVPSLRDDPRVVNIEKCNARYPLTGVVTEKCDLGVSDVSFISQTLILPSIPAILKDGGLYMTLVKPQFECGRQALNKNGIVKNCLDHAEAVRRVAAAALAVGLAPVDLAPSPIVGGDGNREFLLLCRKGPGEMIPESLIRRVCG